MQPQYRGYAQGGPPPRPGAPPPPSNRRSGGIGPMMTPGHSAVPMTQQAVLREQQASEQSRENAKRRSKKPTDKNLPDGVEDAIIGDVVQRYKDLRDFERRLDATMTRKRLDIVDSVSRNGKRYKTLRIWISNTVEDQPWQGSGSNVDGFDFGGNLESSYRVKIEGRLLDDEDNLDKDDDDKAEGEDADKMDTDGAAKPKTNPATAKPGQRSRFSHFFKALTVEYDGARRQGNNEAIVEWKKPDRTPSSNNLPAAADFDELTFKRSGDQNLNVVVNLTRHEEPERFELSPELSDVVDLSEGTRAEIVMALWEYIKLMNLQEDEEKRNFRCDDLLKKIIGRENGYIPMLQEYVNPHLRPLSAIKLPYTIRVDEDFHRDAQPTIYDVRVAVDDPLRGKLLPFIHNPQYASMLKEVALLDEQLSTLVAAVMTSKAKHDFFTGLERDPANFVRTWLSSQKRDLDVIMGEATRGGGEDAMGADVWRLGGKDSIWATQNARESVGLMLAKQPGHMR